MNYRDTFEETVTALSANKVRSGLTILGIVIGIASVIAMVSVGNGAQATIQSSIESLGSNLLIVSPGATRSPTGAGVSTGRGSSETLTPDDADAIASEVSGVSQVAMELSGRYQVTAKGTNTNTTVDGVSPNYPGVRNVTLDTGSFITDQQVQGLSKVAVLGPTTVTDLFGDNATAADAIGQTIRIKGLVFTVIGVTVSKGGSGFTNQDDMIYIPYTSAERYFAGKNYLTSIDIQASDSVDMTQVENDATYVLLGEHGIKDPADADFSILNQADIISTASSVTGTFTLLLAAVAGISLVVGGIGIMNMMLTTVTERTREIGLRKAVGANAADINRQFLLEALALTLVGGIAGVILGWLISWGISLTGALSPVVSLSSVLLAFGVSAAIGVVFGWYPARRAARMNPIDALRYE
jgi:putative ABC transport system permease protein